MELANSLKNFEFTKTKNLKSIEQLAHIAMAMKLEIYEKDSKIINYGDPGEKFYMILKGFVSVYIPDRAKVPEEVYNQRK